MTQAYLSKSSCQGIEDGVGLRRGSIEFEAHVILPVTLITNRGGGSGFSREQTVGGD